jgi:hypothetical protein
MPAFGPHSGSKLVVGFGRSRVASGLCERNGDDKPARLVPTHPAGVQSSLGRLNGVSAIDDFVGYRTIVHYLDLAAAAQIKERAHESGGDL